MKLREFGLEFWWIIQPSYIFLDIHDVIFYTETPEKDRAFDTSFKFQKNKLVASSGLFLGDSVFMNNKNGLKENHKKISLFKNLKKSDWIKGYIIFNIKNKGGKKDNLECKI